MLAAIAAASTHIVSLTVTEKAYRRAAAGALDLTHPEIVRDLARPARPVSAIGWLTAGLALRRESGGSPLTVLSCDNLIGNGRKLAAAVRTLAERWDPALAAWIEAEVAFPGTMVDCIVPATSEASRARIEAALGLTDQACVSREAFAQWVIEDRFAGPRPAWERAGVEFVADVALHERLKLHVLNAAHSALAYLGLQRGHAFVRQAIADPELSGFLDAMMAEEVAPALPGLPVTDYWRTCRARFANPRLDHRLAQIGEDGSSKLAQRIFPLLIANARAGRRTERLAAIVQAWLALAGQGRVKDPHGDRLTALAGWRPAKCWTIRTVPGRVPHRARRAPDPGRKRGLMRVVCIGECMVELRDAGGGLLAKAFAGDAYNTAVYLKRSAPEAQVQFLSVTGADPLSQDMRAAWRAEGIEDEAAFIDPDRTPGLYLIELDAEGERKFHYWRQASAARQWMQRLRAGGGDPLSGADLVYLSGISLAILPEEEREQALLLLKWLHGRVGAIAFDPNVRPALWPDLASARAVIEAAIGLADIVLPSTDDLNLLYGPSAPEALAAKLWRLHAREIALTTGADGCLVVTARRPRRPARARDGGRRHLRRRRRL